MNTKPPILNAKSHASPSVFRPENLLREARRQLNKDATTVPEIVLLDPDGDILKWLEHQGRAERSPGWACYHTELYQFNLDGVTVGIIAQAVGASFAVLLAEQLFVSGCKVLFSMTSSGKISPSLES
ncbi:MAG: uridine phosphorylase, partial [Rhodospirillaceae bacterium]|nr:uridine phosphorylase [Rhodospirillaceae bacterium]